MKVVKIRKGLNIPLKGEASQADIGLAKDDIIAIKPDDFIGFVPKMYVKSGDKVKVGTPVCYNKLNEKIQICSPVSGEVLEIFRGEKRKILEIQIRNDFKFVAEQFSFSTSDILSKNQILELLASSGLFSFIRQRPYDIIPNIDSVPRDIYISCFDSSPLAPDYNFILKDKENYFQKGIDIFSTLSEGKVHLGINAAAENQLFDNITNVEKHYFKGPHPAGNVGVQIHHTHPINKGEIIWYLNPQDVAMIGKFFAEGIYDTSRIIAVTGPSVQNPKYISTIIGAKITNILSENSVQPNTRFISGNALTGTTVELKGFLGYYHHQLTMIPEGNYFEFAGWAAPGLKKFSNSGLFVSKLLPKIDFKLDTNYHGGLRAFVMSGEYEKVFPFDIYPVYLLKAILTDNIDKMEELGIYEVSTEDFALCDFVCTSKIEAQQIVSQGLELIRKEMS